MAVFTPVPHHIPSHQRSTLIETVEVGDQIDIKAILGRPGKLKFITANTTDTIEFKLNNRLELHPTDKTGVPKWPVQEVIPVVVWSQAPHFTTFSLSGQTEYLTDDTVQVSSIEIVALTGVSDIDIVAF